MKQFVTSLLVLVFISCTNQEPFDSFSIENNQHPEALSQIEIESLTFSTSDEISEEEAISMASNFINDVFDSESTQSRSGNNIKISSKIYYQDSIHSRSANDTYESPFYIINATLDNNDQIIYVGANRNSPEIISCVQNNYSNDDYFIKSGAAFLLKWAKESYHSRIVELNENMGSIKNNTITKLEKIYNRPISENLIDSIVRSSYLQSRATPITMPSTQIISKRGPFVTTEWSQTSPYNEYLPEPLYSSSLSHVYTGCAVTAACQLMTAIKPNLSINGIKIDWDKLIENKKISPNDSPEKLRMVGELHKWVYNQLDAEPQYSYGEHTGTGVSASSQVWFYGNYFNHTEEYGSYDPDALLRSFNKGYPSLIRGQGHAWIVDGFIIAEKPSTLNLSKQESRSDIVKVYDMYWHTNLGWGGSYDGYYKLNPDTHVTFESGNYRFSTDGLYVYPGLYAKENELNF